MRGHASPPSRAWWRRRRGVAAWWPQCARHHYLGAPSKQPIQRCIEHHGGDLIELGVWRGVRRPRHWPPLGEGRPGGATPAPWARPPSPPTTAMAQGHRGQAQHRLNTLRHRRVQSSWRRPHLRQRCYLAGGGGSGQKPRRQRWSCAAVVGGGCAASKSAIATAAEVAATTRRCAKTATTTSRRAVLRITAALAVNYATASPTRHRPP